MSCIDFDTLQYCANLSLDSLGEISDDYRSMAKDPCFDDVEKSRLNGIAEGLDKAVEFMIKVLPIQREHVKKIVPSEAPATSVA